MIGSNSGAPPGTNTALETPSAAAVHGGSGDDELKIKLSHGSIIHDISVPTNSTFGDLKKLIPEITGKLLFRGKEKDDGDQLQMAGVKNGSQVLFMESPRAKEMNEPIQLSKGAEAEAEAVAEVRISRGGEAVAEVRAEVDKLSEQVSSLQTVLNGGHKVEDKQIVYLIEMLMRQLLKLDGIEAEGDGKLLRKQEVHRVQSFVDKIDTLKAINSNPFIDSTCGAPAQSVSLESGSTNTNAPTPVLPSTKVTEEWERFD